MPHWDGKMKVRFEAFDGLRGLASLVVVLGHFFDQGPVKNFPGLNLFTDTKVAVAIFFILSGFVLCQKKLPAPPSGNPLNLLSRKVIARFVRLAVPVFGISFLVFLMQPFIRPANDSTVYWNFFTEFYNFERRSTDIVYYPLVDVFFLADFSRNYIPPSWTMRPEFICSIFIFLVPWSKLGQGSWKSVAFLFFVAALLIATYGSLPFFYYLGFFIAGAAIRFLPAEIPYLLKFTILVVCLKTFCNYMGMRFFAFYFLFYLLLVLSIYQLKHMSAIFASSPFLFLGKISFPLYLIHVPLIALIAPRLSDMASALQFESYGALAFVFLIVMVSVLFVSWLLVVLDMVAIILSKKIKP